MRPGSGRNSDVRTLERKGQGHATVAKQAPNVCLLIMVRTGKIKNKKGKFERVAK